MFNNVAADEQILIGVKYQEYYRDDNTIFALEKARLSMIFKILPIKEGLSSE